MNELETIRLGIQLTNAALSLLKNAGVSIEEYNRLLEQAHAEGREFGEREVKILAGERDTALEDLQSSIDDPGPAGG